eukprot:s181_g20.t1
MQPNPVVVRGKCHRGSLRKMFRKCCQCPRVSGRPYYSALVDGCFPECSIYVGSPGMVTLTRLVSHGPDLYATRPDTDQHQRVRVSRWLAFNGVQRWL